MKSSPVLTLIVIACLAAGSTPALADKNFDLHIDNLPDDLVPVDQREPSYPGGIRSGQEGWVRVNFVVTPDGRATDPIIMDSVGGVVFEESVREAVPDWTFEAPGEQHTNVTADIRFEIHLGRDLATSNFMRRSQRIMRHLQKDEIADARASVDQANELGGWNLYESTMLWLMIGRIEGAEGNDVGKLEAYRRARAISTNRSLERDDRLELLHRMFELEMGQSQYAAARETLAALRGEPGSKRILEDLAELVVDLDGRLGSDAPIAARGTLFNASGSDEASPLWSYTPARGTFSFAALSGNVERFEARCARDRLEGPVEPGKTWSLPDDASNCQVFVFGDDGASFDFVEHVENEPVDATARTAVANTDGLD